jgi:hypothetical protein
VAYYHHRHRRDIRTIFSKRVSGLQDKKFEEPNNTCRRKETPIEVKHAQEFLEGFDISGKWKGKDGLHMRRNGGKASRRDMVSQEINRRRSKGAFVWIHLETIS